MSAISALSVRRRDGDAKRPCGRAYARIADRDRSIDCSRPTDSAAGDTDVAALAGRSVLVSTTTQIESASTFVALDGVVRRLVSSPPDLEAAGLMAIIEDAGIDTVVTDAPERFAGLDVSLCAANFRVEDARVSPGREIDTEWVLLTSGSSGRPKMVAHTLAGLIGAITAPSMADGHSSWATFYDVRRYGGLQILLRALLEGANLLLSSDDETIAEYLRRLGAARVEAISGTPSHWRLVLMSAEREVISPSYIRLSGETADQKILDGLRVAYPTAMIEHAYASTEGGVGFAVSDGLEGVPAFLIGQPRDDVELAVVDGTLRIRSNRAAVRYIGASASQLVDKDGFVDTGDFIERRGDRYFFTGRRGGIINVGGLKLCPGDVEDVINRHDGVRSSLVRARANPIVGAVVSAEVVPRDADVNEERLRVEILERCRRSLPKHKVPVMITFVSALPLTAAGKLDRRSKADA